MQGTTLARGCRATAVVSAEEREPAQKTCLNLRIGSRQGLDGQNSVRLSTAAADWHEARHCMVQQAAHDCTL